ncbi:peptidase [Actinosynnema sp. NPDC050436]|uniref:peptidase n=1 Tax=Actinosynnema sp. NPDC050436 TaxID=3155659 RepID=UPI0033F80449
MPSRRTAVVAAAALSALLLAPAAHAAPVTAKSPAEAAAGWLSRQLVDGERFETAVGADVFPDQGLTIDALLAFDAAGVAQDSAGKAYAWLTAPATVASYTSDAEGARYAGAHAKLALAVLAQGGDPTGVGGVDLIAGLTALQAESGRFSDKSKWGDYSNTFSQSLAVITLARHGEAPAKAVEFLLGTACPDGGFPLDIGKPTCTSQADATGLAVQALIAAGQTAQADAGLKWLRDKQFANGGFPDHTQPDQLDVANANSTGLAAQGLRAGGRTVEADKAVAFLQTLQVGCGDATAGAIAKDAKGFQAGNAVRATAQAVLGLAGTGLAEISSTGDRPAAPVLDCPEPTTTTPAPPAEEPPAQPAPVEEPPTTPAAGVTVTGAGPLARTGVEPAPALGLGALLVLAGALVLVAARRRDPAPAGRSTS